MRTEVAKAMAGRRTSLVVALMAVIASLLMPSLSPAVAVAAVSEPAAPAGITISPSQKDITINPGLIAATTNVTITNKSGARLLGTLRLLDINTAQASGYAFLSPTSGSSGQYGLANYMTLPNGDTLNVADGQSVTIPIRIDNRADLAPGGHYGALIVGFGDPNAAVAAGQADFKQQLASLIFVRKRGGERLGLSLSELKVLPTGTIPKIAILKFTNSGNVHVAPEGYITVATAAGKLVAKAIINTDATLILPGTSKLLETNFQMLDNHLSAGRYTVTAYYRYDEQGAFSKKSIQFDYQKKPNVLIIGGSIAAGLLLLFGGIFLKKRF